MTAQPPEPRVRAAVGLALSGRYREPATQAAHGLRVWAEHAGAELSVVDTGAEPDRVEAIYADLVGRAELLFGPYGSGPLRAAQRSLAGTDAVLWNHGGAAGDALADVRVVDVLGPAERYWTGLATVLGRRGCDLDKVAIAHAPTGFGQRTAAGAVEALQAVGQTPYCVRPFDQSNAGQVARSLLAMDPSAVIACGRMEDDVALISSIPPAAVALGAIVAGVDLARDRLGVRVIGCFGPAQWLPVGAHPLGGGAEYPAAQAYAAGQVAAEALRVAGSADPESLWAAAIELRTRTLLGPFRIDHDGRQQAHSPLLVEWVAARAGPERRPIWLP